MEFVSTTTKFHILHVSFLVAVYSIATTVLNPVVFATKDCNFPAIFNFGDSNSDTGGLAATALVVPPPPYGQTYFHRPTGRTCDGRVLIDFIAQSFGLPYLSGYLDSLGTNFSHGANFATLAATVKPPSNVLPTGDTSPFYLDVQCAQFKEFKARTQFIRHQGGIFAGLMPKEEYFAQALYIFDIGQSDLNIAFLTKTLQQVNASIFDIINSLSKNIKNIYNLGGRSFWILNMGPTGCLPYILTKFLSAERDDFGCAKLYNDLSQIFNQKLMEAVVQLRKDLPLAAITYVDIYSIKYSIFSNPKKYGFEDPLVACCGFGGSYNFNEAIACGGTIEVNDTQVFVGSCKRPHVRVSWDGAHYTEVANKFVSNQIFTGNFSDPPFHLNMACHIDSTTKKYY